MKLIKNDFCIVFLKYIIRHRKIPKLKNPKTFNEKIAYNKLYSESELLAPLCDKYLVKEHIRKKIGDKYVLDTLFVTSKPESIPFNDLPNSFIIKATHGSGWNIIVKNKKEINFNDIVKKCNFFLSMNYYYLGRERQYKNIEPQIMIEKLLLDAKGEVPKDYKFFSFNGKIEFIQVDIDRGGSHKRNFYDCNWNRMPFELNYPSYEFDIEKPSRLNKMLKISENLSSGLDFARIDLYYISDKIYFGEITFTPENNLGRFYPMIYDRIWGERLKI